MIIIERLKYITHPKRDVPLQPGMLFDFFQNEIGIDVRVVSFYHFYHFYYHF